MGNLEEFSCWNPSQLEFLPPLPFIIIFHPTVQDKPIFWKRSQYQFILLGLLGKLIVLCIAHVHFQTKNWPSQQIHSEMEKYVYQAQLCLQFFPRNQSRSGVCIFSDLSGCAQFTRYGWRLTIFASQGHCLAQLDPKKLSVVSPTAATFYFYQSFWSVLGSQALETPQLDFREY